MWAWVVKIFLILSVAGVLLLAFAYWSKLVLGAAKTRKFAREVSLEMRNVTWPTRQEVANATLVVAVLSFVMMVMVSGSDYVLGHLVRKLFGIG